MSHSFGAYQFEFWDGPTPAVCTRKLNVTHQPGVSGVAHQVLGTWGETFSAVLTSHHPTWEAAVERYALLQRDLVGTGPQYLIHEDWMWSGFTSTYYNIESIDLIEMRRAIILIGPSMFDVTTGMYGPYSYSGGVSLVTRFTMTPQAV